jgi:peptide/nickel transport system ATP-binding protein
LVLKVRDLVVEFPTEGGKVTAVDNVSLEIPEGETLGLVGESGSGKTTLGMSFLRMIEPPGRIAGGSISWNESDLLSMSPRELRNYRWKVTSMVFQSAMNSLNPVETVSEQVAEVLREHTDVSNKEARAKALELLSDVGIDAKRAHDYPHQFSGGMRQRVVIAMSLALAPKLLIADEPTSALDVVVQKQILSLLKRKIAHSSLSMVFITHEIALLNGLVENVAVMYMGEIVEMGPLKSVLGKPLHPYSEMLLESMLSMETPPEILSRERKVGMQSSSAPEGACKFAGRCKYAFARCRAERPKLEKVDETRWVACFKYS